MSVKSNPEMTSDDDRYRRKLDDLQKHVPFIEAMLKHLRSTKEKSREVQLTKMESLYAMITDTRRKVKYHILLKCEEVIEKLKDRMKSNTATYSPEGSRDREEVKSESTTPTLINNNLKDESKQDRSDSIKEEITDGSNSDSEEMAANFRFRRHIYARTAWNHKRRRGAYSPTAAATQNIILPIVLEAMKGGNPDADDSPNYAYQHQEPTCSRYPTNPIEYYNDCEQPGGGDIGAYYDDQPISPIIGGGIPRNYRYYNRNKFRYRFKKKDGFGNNRRPFRGRSRGGSYRQEQRRLDDDKMSKFIEYALAADNYDYNIEESLDTIPPSNVKVEIETDPNDLISAAAPIKPKEAGEPSHVQMNSDDLEVKVKIEGSGNNDVETNISKINQAAPSTNIIESKMLRNNEVPKPIKVRLTTPNLYTTTALDDSEAKMPPSRSYEGLKPVKNQLDIAGKSEQSAGKVVKCYTNKQKQRNSSYYDQIYSHMTKLKSLPTLYTEGVPSTSFKIPKKQIQPPPMVKKDDPIPIEEAKRIKIAPVESNRKDKEVLGNVRTYTRKEETAKEGACVQIKRKRKSAIALRNSDEELDREKSEMVDSSTLKTETKEEAILHPSDQIEGVKRGKEAILQPSNVKSEAKRVKEAILQPSNEKSEAKRVKEAILQPSNEKSEAKRVKEAILQPSNEKSEAKRVKEAILQPSNEKKEAILQPSNEKETKRGKKATAQPSNKKEDSIFQPSDKEAATLQPSNQIKEDKMGEGSTRRPSNQIKEDKRVEEATLRPSNQIEVKQGEETTARPSNQIEDVNKNSQSNPSDILDFILKNYKQIKKILENDSSDDEGRSRKRKRKRKRKKRYSSSSSSTRGSEEEFKSNKKRKKKKKKRRRSSSLLSPDDSKPVKADEEKIIPEIDERLEVAKKKSPSTIEKKLKVKDKEEIVVKKKPATEQKLRKGELDILHDDIKDMWMSGDVINATGRRTCTMNKELTPLVPLKPAKIPSESYDEIIEKSVNLRVVLRREDFKILHCEIREDRNVPLVEGDRDRSRSVKYSHEDGNQCTKVADNKVRSRKRNVSLPEADVKDDNPSDPGNRTRNRKKSVSLQEDNQNPASKETKIVESDRINKTRSRKKSVSLQDEDNPSRESNRENKASIKKKIVSDRSSDVNYSHRESNVLDEDRSRNVNYSHRESNVLDKDKSGNVNYSHRESNVLDKDTSRNINYSHRESNVLDEDNTLDVINSNQSKLISTNLSQKRKKLVSTKEKDSDGSHNVNYSHKESNMLDEDSPGNINYSHREANVLDEDTSGNVNYSHRESNVLDKETSRNVNYSHRESNVLDEDNTPINSNESKLIPASQSRKRKKIQCPIVDRMGLEDDWNAPVSSKINTFLSGHHSKDYYARLDPMPCKLCSYNGKRISFHYKYQHAKFEVLCSRLSPKITERLIADSERLNYDELESIGDNPRVKYDFVCPFCLAHIKSDHVGNFYHHLTGHTGEYKYSCENCDYVCHHSGSICKHHATRHGGQRKVRTRPTPPNSNLVLGFVCIECHYVQTDRRNLRKHVELYHGNKATVVKVNLNFIDAQRDVPLSDNSWEVSIETSKDRQDEEDVDIDVGTDVDAGCKIETSSIDVKSETEWEEISAKYPESVRIDSDNGSIKIETRSDGDDDSSDVACETTLEDVDMRNVPTVIGDKLQSKFDSESVLERDRKKSAPISNIINRLQGSLKPTTLPAERQERDDETITLFYENLKSTPIAKINESLQDSVPPLVHYSQVSPTVPDHRQNSPKTYKPAKKLTAATNGDQPPPLSHYSQFKEQKVATKIFQLGPIQLLRDTRGMIFYACFVQGCVFCTTSEETFGMHCKLTHSEKVCNSWTCNLCETVFDRNKFLHEMFTHLVDVHRDCFGNKSKPGRCSDEVDVDSTNSVVEVCSQDADRQNVMEPKFKFVISKVRSLSKESSSPSMPPLLNAELTAIDPSPSFINYLLTDPQPSTTNTIVAPPVTVLNTIKPITKAPSMNVLNKNTIAGPSIPGQTALKTINAALKTIKVSSTAVFINQQQQSTVPINNNPATINIPPLKEVTSPTTSTNLRRYIRAVPLSKLVEGKDLPNIPSAKIPPPVRCEKPHIPDKITYVREKQLAPSQIAHFYKCPVFDCAFSSPLSGKFAEHIVQHRDCYVFCLYCSAIVKLSLYSTHLTDAHYASRFACTKCFYRGSCASYVKAHMDTAHGAIGDYARLTAPLSMMPNGTQDPDVFLPVSDLIQPFICDTPGFKLKTIFMDRISKHLAYIAQAGSHFRCGYCFENVNADILLHFTAHDIHPCHCRYCHFGSQFEQVIVHMAEAHANLPFYIISRKTPPIGKPVRRPIVDEYSCMLVLTEDMFESKYTSFRKIEKKDCSLEIVDGVIYSWCKICKRRGTCHHLYTRLSRTQMTKGKVITVVTKQEGKESIRSQKLIVEDTTVVVPLYVGSNRYLCGGPDCTECFDSSATLYLHLKAVHSNDTSYTCHHCRVLFEFTQEVDFALFAKHAALHSRTIYRCRHCYFLEDNVDNMRAHVETMHPNKPGRFSKLERVAASRMLRPTEVQGVALDFGTKKAELSGYGDPEEMRIGSVSDDDDDDDPTMLLFRDP